MVDKRWSTSQVESALRELRGVCGARVVADETGLIQEIHLLVEGDRNPKQVVRDVESALMAHFGIHIDHRKISVAQKSSTSRTVLPSIRLRWLDVQMTQEGTRATATALLERNGQVFRGSASGIRASTQLPRLVASATLRAVESAYGLHERFGLEEVATSWSIGGHPIVVVLISAIRDQGEDLLVGSALVRQDLYRAVGLATLDAVNRRVVAFPTDQGVPVEAVVAIEKDEPAVQSGS